MVLVCSQSQQPCSLTSWALSVGTTSRVVGWIVQGASSVCVRTYIQTIIRNRNVTCRGVGWLPLWLALSSDDAAWRSVPVSVRSVGFIASLGVCTCCRLAFQGHRGQGSSVTG
jgi:hypothetical protein